MALGRASVRRSNTSAPRVDTRQPDISPIILNSYRVVKSKMQRFIIGFIAHAHLRSCPMIVILSFIKAILLPLFVLSFVALGLGAAMTSATIEVQVFHSLLASGGNANTSTLLSWVIIGSFEMCKLMTTYMSSIKISAIVLPVSKRTLSLVHLFFVSISLVATFAYVSNSLYGSLTTDERRSALQQQISNLETQVVNVKETIYNPDTDKRLDSYRQTFDTAVAIANAHQSNWDTSTYQERVNQARDDLTQATQQYQDEFDQEKAQNIADLEEQISACQSELTLANNDVLRSKNNPLIDRVLSLVWRTLSSNSYPQSFYWLCCILTSLVLSIGIEIVITSVFTFIAAPDAILLKLFYEDEQSIRAHSFLFKCLMQAFCGFACILLVNLIVQYTTGTSCIDLVVSLVSLMAGLPLINIFARSTSSAKSENSPKHGDTPIISAVQKLIERGGQIGISSAILIVIYFLIGLLTHSIDPSAMSIPQASALIAGALGSTFLQQLPANRTV